MGEYNAPESFSITVDTVSSDDAGHRVVTFTSDFDNLVFEQTESLTRDGIAMHKYGALVYPLNLPSGDPSPIHPQYEIRARMSGTAYTAMHNLPGLVPGTSITLTRVSA